jgi:hypothetical protein
MTRHRARNSKFRSTARPAHIATERVVAIEAAEYLKWKHPHSEVVVTDLRSTGGGGGSVQA